jgi:hypothetical protein
MSWTLKEKPFLLPGDRRCGLAAGPARESTWAIGSGVDDPDYNERQDTLPADQGSLYVASTDVELVRELPAGRAEALFFLSSAITSAGVTLSPDH